MSVNLLDMLTSQVTGELAKKASSFLGESEANTTSGLNAIFPTLLGSMMDKVAEPNGAKGIMGMIDKLDNNMLGNIGSIFGGGASSVNNVLNSGGGIVDLLLGNKMGGIIDIIKNVSGMKSGSSSSLLKMAAPFLLSMIGKQISGRGIAGLKDLLFGQKDAVRSAMPAGVGSLLGLASLGDNLKETARATTAKMSDTADRARTTASRTTANYDNNSGGGGMGWLKWLLPLLLLALVGYWLMQRGCGADLEKAAEKTVETTKNVAEKTGEAIVDAATWTVDGIKGVFTNIDEAAKEALGKIKFQANSAGDQMIRFIDGGFKGDPVFRFTHLNYATGSAQIDAKSAQEISNIAAILKAYPDVKLRVEGHTDNVGDAASNKKLSQARAEAVKARLIADGISADRLDAVGYGQEMPIASNDTEEGRAENRRTVLRLMK